MRLLDALRRWPRRRALAGSATATALPGHGAPAPGLLNDLQDVLSEHGHSAHRLGDGELRLDSGIVLRAELVRTTELAPSRFSTLTIVHARHPEVFPEGVFEYQHAAGASARTSLHDGFAHWIRMDLVALEDALRVRPVDCPVLQVEGTDTRGRPISREVLLGPLGHLVGRPEEDPSSSPSFEAEELYEASRLALSPWIHGDRFVGMRLFASRDRRGEPGSDCRVNGEDHAEGAAALDAYVRTWPGQGLEFRKQYVVVRTAR